MEFPISKLAIKKPTTIFLFMVLLIIAGWVSYQELPREAAPDVDWPHLYVTIPFPGATPADVESQITDKVEQELQNVENLEEMRSRSVNNYVTVDLMFAFGYDLDKARTKVREALDRVKNDLPEDSEDWSIDDFNLSESPIITINLSSTAGLNILKEEAENLKDMINRVPGVLTVNRFGGLEKEVQVRVDPEKLRFYNMDLNTIANTIVAENRTIPGGTVTVGPRELFISIPGDITSPLDISEMIITDNDGGQVRVKDVADVRFTYKEVESKSRLNGVESVSLEVSKRTGENLIRVTDDIKALVKNEQERQGDRIKYSIISDDSEFVSQFVKNLENNIYSGMIFVFIVLFLFLGKRNALFVGIAIPFSMLMSFLVIRLAGYTLNMITLVALIISLGMLVDNAIVIVENIYRHIQSGKTRAQAALTGTSEVAGPVITSTMTTLLVFIPLIWMPGIMGEFMRFMPITLIVTLTCSLIVGLVFNPVICSVLMKKPDKQQVLDEEELVMRSAFLVRYSKMLEWTLKHRFLTLMFLLAFWVGMAVYYLFVANPEKKTEFFPKEEPRQAVIRVSSPKGTILEEADKVVKQVENGVLRYQKYTDSIVTNVDGTENKIRMNFPDWQEWTEARPSEVIERVRKLLPRYTGAEIRIDQQGGMGPPVGRDVNVEFLGKNLDELKKVTDDISRLIKGVPGLVNLETSADANRSQIKIDIDREKIARHGLRTSQVASIIRTAFNGSDISTYKDGLDEYDIVMRLDEKFRRSDTDLGTLYITTVQGKSIPLSELATVTREPAGGAITHLDLKRVISVEGDTSRDRSGAEVLKDIKAIIDEYPMPLGVRVSYAGADSVQTEMQGFLIQTFGVAIFLIFLLLVTQFNSLALPFIIITSVFASFAGIFLGMSIHGTPISVLMGGLGAISLAGIVVNNAIVLIDYIRQLREKGYEVSRAIVLAGMSRLRPVILTAVTTILGLLPITMGMDIDFYRFPNIIMFGSEGGTFWKPMNLSIIYGLSVATFLTLFLVPVLYSLNESFNKRSVNLFRRLKPKRATRSS